MNRYHQQRLTALPGTLFILLALLVSPMQAREPQLTLETLDNWLTEAESAYPDIVPGTAKSVQWANGVEKTQLALIYVHGFSASARELSPVTEDLGRMLGANVFFTRLAGHGRSGEAMAEASREKWFADMREAWQIGQLLGEQVIIVSTSTGGTLAMWLANQEFADSLAANILISPNFGIKNRIGEIVRWEWGFAFAKWMSGPTREFTPINDIHARYWTEKYPIEAVVPMVKLVDDVLDMDKSRTRAPHLLVYSPQDQVIRVDRIEEIAPQLHNADVTLQPFTESEDPWQHVLAGEACSPGSSSAMTRLLHDYLVDIGLSRAIER